jgi:hypothetical protein
MKTKWYEIEVASKTYRTYQIKAESIQKAKQLALSAVDEDWEISGAWKQGAEVESCQQLVLNKDGNMTTDTSHLNNEEFGNYIKDNCK